MITLENMLQAFASEVVEWVKRPKDVDEYSTSYNEPKTFEVRVRTQVGGAFWALRSISSDLSYAEANEFERRCQEFFHNHCKNIMDLHDGVKTPEYQD
jgi:hypothetical protein